MSQGPGGPGKAREGVGGRHKNSHYFNSLICNHCLWSKILCPDITQIQRPNFDVTHLFTPIILMDMKLWLLKNDTNVQRIKHGLSKSA